MVRLNRKVEYALVALKVLSSKKPGELTTVNEICGATGVPFDATSRVMQLMAQKSILKSEHGAHGGYQIIKSLNRVSLYDIMELTLGPVEIVRCLGQQGDECELTTSCNIKLPLKIFNHRLQDFYKNLTISDLLLLKDNNEESRWTAPAQQTI
jgi:Rrf2 family protein